MRTTPQTFLRFIAGAAVAAAVLFLVWYFRSIVVYVLISAVLAVMGNPLVKRLAALHIKGWKVPRWLAALATLIVIWVVLATLCSLFVPLVFNKIYQLSNVDFATVVASIEEPIARAQSYLHEFFAMPESTFSLSEALASALKQVIDIESLNTVFASIVNVVLSSGFIAGAAVAAAVLFLVWYFRSIVVYVLISAVLAVMGNPLVKRLAALHIKGWKVPRWLAALATLIVIWVVLATLCSLFVPLVFNKIYQLSNVDFATVVASIEEPIARAQSYLHEFFAMPESTFSLSEALASALKQVIDIESLNTVFASIVNVVLSSVIAIFSITFITFFFLRDEGLFYAMITAMFPERYHENITRALDSVTLLLARYFTGILSESLLLMVAVSLTMMAFGMKAADAAFIGLVMGVMNVVPYAGPLIGGVVSVFVGIVTPIGGMTVGHTAAVIIGSLLILKGLDDFVLQPTLYSSRVKAHPLEIFLVILIAGSLAGILGMLLAIPSYTVLRVFAKEFFSQFSLVRKLTEKI